VELHRTIGSSRTAPVEARAAVAEAGDDVPPEMLRDAMLAVSEVVTNSYQHAGLPEGSPIDVGIQVSAEALRIEVVDHSIFDPTPESEKEREDERWGLKIVDAVASDWGRISEGGLWMEFRLPRE
jgi:anti-sigma regulatory factor (Ser/Thr protein kinase)